MCIDRLEIDLRPRSNAQALDLGLALLRANKAAVYLPWLLLWVPLVALCALLSWLGEDSSGWPVLLAWWLRPLLERAPLYVLSRKVFGEDVGWHDALRAWPSQLGGGWCRLLTWWRPFMPGRGLYQPIWMLEGARGKVAAERRTVIGGRGTGRSAFWFGSACAHFEVVLQVGTLALAGLFMSSEGSANPFAFLPGTDAIAGKSFAPLAIIAFGIGSAVMGPVYTACCFTLYLNRRATLEAWDIELMLRQLPAPSQAQPQRMKSIAGIAALVLAVFLQPSVSEAKSAATGQCEPPEAVVQEAKQQKASREPDTDAEQASIRQDIDEVYASPELRSFECFTTRLFNQDFFEDTESEPVGQTPSWFADLALGLRLLLIAGAILLIIWLLVRYRDQLGSLFTQRKARPAMEVAGLDIRPESLPDDVVASVMHLWKTGQRRNALALLYRATLSRLVVGAQLQIPSGATEEECLRLARLASAGNRLTPERLEAATVTTRLWQHGAYAGHWPDTETVRNLCQQWHAAFNAVLAHAR